MERSKKSMSRNWTNEWLEFSAVIIFLFIAAYVIDGLLTGSWEIKDISSHIILATAIVGLDGALSYWSHKK